MLSMARALDNQNSFSIGWSNFFTPGVEIHLEMALRHVFIAAVIVCTAVLAQGPFDGVSKTTYASSQPWLGAAFNLRYFPVTMAEDSGKDNIEPMFNAVQGRVQLTKAGQFPMRNCELYSGASGSKSDSGTSMSAPASRGKDCVYETSQKYTLTTSMWSVYAHTPDQCCKACSATEGCTNAYFNSTKDNSVRRVQPGPQSYEGFGLHLVNVTTSLTNGGIAVSELEARFDERLGNMSSFDAFMDYNVVLFAGKDMPSYANALSHDGVPFFTASWQADTGDTWYSMFVHTPKSQMVIELVGKVSPGARYENTLPSLEPRVSPRNVALFASQNTNGVLAAVAVTRACSNISIVEYFYTNAIGAKTVHKVDAAGMSRRCFAWPGAKSDVCFVSRPPSDTTSFGVRDLEEMIWTVHKQVITKVDTYNDKYNDNHYAVDLGSFSGDNITAFMIAHKAEAFPIDFPKTFYAWDCDQDYLIDPTGWAIQSDFMADYPGCTDVV